MFAPRPKELNFFNRDSQFDKGLDWYSDTYFGPHSRERVICDNSIGYSTGDPEQTMERIVGALGRDFRILLTIRDPIDRAYSNYCMARYKGRIEDLEFLQAIRSGIGVEQSYTREELQAALDQKTYYSDAQSMAIFRHAVYLVPGQYARLLKLCRATVGSENVLVLFTDDMSSDLDKAMRKLTEFLRVGPFDASNEQRRNQSTTLRYPWLRQFYNWLMSFGAVRATYDGLNPENRRTLRRNLLAWNYRRNEAIPEMDPAARELLRGYYRAEVDSLQSILDRDLSHW